MRRRKKKTTSNGGDAVQLLLAQRSPVRSNNTWSFFTYLSPLLHFQHYNKREGCSLNQSHDAKLHVFAVVHTIKSYTVVYILKYDNQQDQWNKNNAAYRSNSKEYPTDSNIGNDSSMLSCDTT